MLDTIFSNSNDLVQEINHKNIRPVPKMLMIPGFFPGCIGTYTGKPPQKGQTLIIGQDFGLIRDYKELEQPSDRNLEIDTNSTWRGLRYYRDEFGLNLEQCVFINFFPGLRDDNIGVIGRHPFFTNKGALKQCGELLIETLNTLNPKDVIVLGRHVMNALGCLKLVEGWDRNNRLRDNCKRISTISYNISKSVPIIAVHHPCMCQPNINRNLDFERKLLGNFPAFQI